MNELIPQTEALIASLQAHVERLKAIEAQTVTPMTTPTGPDKPDHWKTDAELKQP